MLRTLWTALSMIALLQNLVVPAQAGVWDDVVAGVTRRLETAEYHWLNTVERPRLLRHLNTLFRRGHLTSLRALCHRSARSNPAQVRGCVERLSLIHDMADEDLRRFAALVPEGLRFIRIEAGSRLGIEGTTLRIGTATPLADVAAYVRSLHEIAELKTHITAVTPGLSLLHCDYSAIGSSLRRRGVAASDAAACLSAMQGFALAASSFSVITNVETASTMRTSAVPLSSLVIGAGTDIELDYMREHSIAVFSVQLDFREARAAAATLADFLWQRRHLQSDYGLRLRCGDGASYNNCREGFATLAAYSTLVGVPALFLGGLNSLTIGPDSLESIVLREQGELLDALTLPSSLTAPQVNDFLALRGELFRSNSSALIFDVDRRVSWNHCDHLRTAQLASDIALCRGIRSTLFGWSGSSALSRINAALVDLGFGAIERSPDGERHRVPRIRITSGAAIAVHIIEGLGIDFVLPRAEDFDAMVGRAMLELEGHFLARIATAWGNARTRFIAELRSFFPADHSAPRAALPVPATMSSRVPTVPAHNAAMEEYLTSDARIADLNEALQKFTSRIAIAPEVLSRLNEANTYALSAYWRLSAEEQGCLQRYWEQGDTVTRLWEENTPTLTMVPSTDGLFFGTTALPYYQRIITTLRGDDLGENTFFFRGYIMAPGDYSIRIGKDACDGEGARTEALCRGDMLHLNDDGTTRGSVATATSGVSVTWHASMSEGGLPRHAGSTRPLNRVLHIVEALRAFGEAYSSLTDRTSLDTLIGTVPLTFMPPHMTAAQWTDWSSRLSNGALPGLPYDIHRPLVDRPQAMLRFRHQLHRRICVLPEAREREVISSVSHDYLLPHLE